MTEKVAKCLFGFITFIGFVVFTSFACEQAYEDGGMPRLMMCVSLMSVLGIILVCVFLTPGHDLFKPVEKPEVIYPSNYCPSIGSCCDNANCEGCGYRQTQEPDPTQET